MKKIMFNSKYGLDKAVLEGRKTMTRMIIPEKIIDEYHHYDDYCNSVGLDGVDMSVERKLEKEFFLEHSPYKVGEVIAIAQSYKDCGYDMELIIDGKLMYKHPGWNNKMFVKAELMKHFIKITGVKVERLQDITPEDCLREGIMKVEDKNTGYCRYGFTGCRQDYPNPLIAFKELWRAIDGKDSFHFDQWVWVYEFELTDNTNKS